jgi:hypothetical protein
MIPIGTDFKKIREIKRGLHKNLESHHKCDIEKFVAINDFYYECLKKTSEQSNRSFDKILKICVGMLENYYKREEEREKENSSENMLSDLLDNIEEIFLVDLKNKRGNS